MTDAVIRVDRCLDAAALDRVHQALAELWARAPHVADTDRTLFEIAVLEVATNVVVHGRTATEATIELRASETEVQAIFRDNGAPTEVDVAAAEWPGELAENGRGLPMARAALDDFSHHRVDDLNVWRLRRALSDGRDRD